MPSDEEIGWRDGKLVMDSIQLSHDELKRLDVIRHLAFGEMAERTRAGSGDDQAYVDEAYSQMIDKGNKHYNGNYTTLVEIVFKLMRKDLALARADEFERIFEQLSIEACETPWTCSKQVLRNQCIICQNIHKIKLSLKRR